MDCCVDTAASDALAADLPHGGAGEEPTAAIADGAGVVTDELVPEHQGAAGVFFRRARDDGAFGWLLSSSAVNHWRVFFGCVGLTQTV